jgi:hypothetical protein
VAKLGSLGIQIIRIVRGTNGCDRNADHCEPEVPKGRYFPRVVGHLADVGSSQVTEHGSAHGEVPFVPGKAQCFICGHGVKPGVL